MHLLHLLRMVAGYVGGLSDVFAQVMQHEGHREGDIDNLRGGFWPIDRQLESTLADGKGTIAVIVHECLVKRPAGGFSRQRPEETLTIFGGVAVQIDVQHLRQGWDDIIEDDRRWTTPAWFNFWGPADEERHAVSALLQSCLPSAKWPVAVMSVNRGVASDPPGLILLCSIHRAIVAGEDDERVFVDSEFDNFAQNPANVVVEFDDEIPVRPGAAGAHEFPGGDDRVMRRRH